MQNSLAIVFLYEKQRIFLKQCEGEETIHPDSNCICIILENGNMISSE